MNKFLKSAGDEILSLVWEGLFVLPACLVIFLAATLAGVDSDSDI